MAAILVSLIYTATFGSANLWDIERAMESLFAHVD